MKAKIKKGEEVVVLTGNNRGERGKVLKVLPKEGRVLVENINKRKHFEKKKENQAGSIIEREVPMNLSNVMQAARYDARLAKRNPAVSS